MGKFRLNCTYFEIKNPRAAALLSLVDAEHLQIKQTELGESTLADMRGPSPSFYHSLKGAHKEAEEAFFSLKGTAPVICIYGIGLGYGYLALEAWLKENQEHTLIFLEDDLAVLSRFLETDSATQLLKDPQVHLYFIEAGSEGVQVLQEIAWSTFPQKLVVGCLPYYAKTKSKLFQEIKNRLHFEVSDIHAVLDEYVLFGVPFFRNFWKNLFYLPESLQGNSLFNKFKNVPAIIVAAGPSLTKQLSLLAELKDRALIFTGGSGVNALTDAGIMPHFAGAIDPNPMQYVRVRQGLGLEVPFFYRHRVLNEVCSLISGPKLYLSGGDGYNISDWFEKRFKIKGKVLGGGHSIANFSLEIAHALGCRPIILVGFDLAYTNQKAYADGVEEKSKKSFSDEEQKQEQVLWQDIYGQPITTAWKWVLEAKWISEFKRKHRKIPIVNATEGGIPIDGVPNITLKDAVDKFLVESYDLEGQVHTAIQQAPYVKCTDEAILKEMQKMFKSLARSIELLDVLIAECKKSVQKVHPLENTTSILTLEKLHHEIAFEYILDVFDRMQTKLDYHKLRFAIGPHLSDAKKRKIERKLMLGHFIFLKEVAVVNYLFIERTANEATGRNA